MATRSTIWKQNEDGTFKGIYCHWDGYISNNGKILVEHYTDIEKIDKLLAGGSLSALDKNLNPEEGIAHDFTSRQDGVCLFHHRDIGYDLKVYNLDTLDEIKDYLEEYNYIFKENKWYLYENGKLTKLKIKE